MLTVNVLPWNLLDLCFEPNSCLPCHLSEVRKAPQRKIESERVTGNHPSDGLVSDKGEASFLVSRARPHGRDSKERKCAGLSSGRGGL